eukprot:SAG22_NODE_526_length_9463_cov_8.286523_3_plen_38_part_00
MPVSQGDSGDESTLVLIRASFRQHHHSQYYQQYSTML